MFLSTTIRIINGLLFEILIYLEYRVHLLESGTIENLLTDRDFKGCQQAPNELPTTSVLFQAGKVEILSCNSL